MKNTNLTSEDLARLSQLLDSLSQAKKDKNEKSEIEAKIMDFFRQTGIKTYHYGDVTIRFTDERETNEFDVETLMSKYPEIWKECHAIHKRPPHLLIKKTTRVSEDDDLPTPEEIMEEIAG